MKGARIGSPSGRELNRWMVRAYGYRQWDACMMLSQCRRVCSGNSIVPNYTLGAALARSFLAG